MPRFKRDTDTGEFIPFSDWEEKYGKEPRRSTQIMRDIEDFVSPIDGTIITSRPKLEAHNKKHGVTNINDYSEGHFEKGGKKLQAQARGQTAQDKKDRCQLIDKTLNDHGV
jgi:hypothetical protein